jgi:hypothetical protein
MDSEAFSALLINRLNKKGAQAAAIAEVTKQFASLGKLNFILSDGNEFYFFSNHDGLNYRIAEGAVYVATVPVGENKRDWKSTTPGVLYVATNGRIISEVTVETGATFSPKLKKRQTFLSEREWDDLEEFIRHCKERLGAADQLMIDTALAAAANVDDKANVPAHRQSSLDTLCRDLSRVSHAVGTSTTTAQATTTKRQTRTAQPRPIAQSPLPPTRPGSVWSWSEIEAARAAMRG